MIQWFLKHAVYQTVCFYHGTGETMRNISSFWHRAPKTFVISCVHAQSFSHGQHSVTPWTVACQAPLSMDSPGKNPGVGCHFLLQGIFQTQGSNPGLPHCRQILSLSEPRGKPLYIYISILEACSWRKENEKNRMGQRERLRRIYFLDTCFGSHHQGSCEAQIAYKTWSSWARLWRWWDMVVMA